MSILRKILYGENAAACRPLYYSYSALPCLVPPVYRSVLQGLHARPQVLVVQEGMTKEPGISSNKIGLPEGVNVKMRVTELMAPDGSIGFQPDVIVAKSNQEDARLKAASRRMEKMLLTGPGRIQRGRAFLELARTETKTRCGPARTILSNRYRSGCVYMKVTLAFMLTIQPK